MEGGSQSGRLANDGTPAWVKEKNDETTANDKSEMDTVPADATKDGNDSNMASSKRADLLNAL